MSFARVANVPPRGIGAKTFAALTMWSEMQGMSPAKAVLHLAEGNIRRSLAGYVTGPRQARGPRPFAE